MKTELQLLSAITIEELVARAPLMNRSDRKFLFHKQALSEILEACSSDYSVLEMGHSRIFNYETEYFDTPTMEFYLNHQRGKSNRFKVRRRLYGSSNEEFIEVKHKTNKGNTIKLRVDAQALDLAKLLIETEIGKETAADLQPQLMVKYNRITLLHNDRAEKVTLDFNIQFEARQLEPNALTFNQLIIAEVKASNLRANVFQGIMKRRGIREGSMSKYCMGCISVFPNIKHNRFKQTYKHILQIENA